MNLHALPEEALKEILALTEAKRRLELREEATEKFMPFAHHVYENFIEGQHHRIIAEKLERVARGELKRLIINMPPRHSKSEFASFLMPAWFLGRIRQCLRVVHFWPSSASSAWWHDHFGHDPLGEEGLDGPFVGGAGPRRNVRSVGSC